MLKPTENFFALLVVLFLTLGCLSKDKALNQSNSNPHADKTNDPLHLIGKTEKEVNQILGEAPRDTVISGGARIVTAFYRRSGLRIDYSDGISTYVSAFPDTPESPSLQQN